MSLQSGASLPSRAPRWPAALGAAAAAAAGLLAFGNVSLPARGSAFLGSCCRSSISCDSLRRCRHPGAAVLRRSVATETEQDIRREAADSADLDKLRDLANRGLADEAEDSLYDFIDAGGQPEAAHFAAVISACAPGSDTERAERWLFRMRALQVEPDGEVYHALMRVAAEAGSSTEAESWMMESWKAGFEPDLVSFTLMLKALRKAGEGAKVESWFERLMERGLNPDIACVNEVIGLYAEQEKLAKVTEWFSIAAQSLGLAPDVETFRLVISALTVAGDIQAAEEYVDKMIEQNVKPDASIYVLLTGNGRSERPLEVIERWTQRLVDDNMEMDSEAYTAVIGAWASAGEPQRAEEWYSRMVQDGLGTAEALALLVDALVLQQSSEEGAEAADEWMGQFVDMGKELTPSVHAARASAYCCSGDFEQVEAAMQSMEMDGLEMNEDCLTVMLLAYANAQPQQTLLAEQMFKQQMLRGKMRATREVLEALRAAVGGSRCLSLRRELQISSIGGGIPKSEMAAVDIRSLEARKFNFGKPRDSRVWQKLKKPEPPKQPLSWE